MIKLSDISILVQQYLACQPPERPLSHVLSDARLMRNTRTAESKEQ
jgi:hypothetical protein